MGLQGMKGGQPQHTGGVLAGQANCLSLLGYSAPTRGLGERSVSRGPPLLGFALLPWFSPAARRQDSGGERRLGPARRAKDGQQQEPVS